MQRPTRQHGHGERGAALITVLMLTAMLSALLGSYFVLTRVELSATEASMESTRGFFVGEAGLNLRAEEIRQLFLGFNRPAGTTPVPTPGTVPCAVGDQGAGDFVCRDYPFRNRRTYTYVSEDPGNPTAIVIPPGENVYANLNALEYAYTVHSVATNDDTQPEAILEMQFKSRLVPLFQFAVFYNKDLEITPGPPMVFSGPVHTNFDLYGAAWTSVDVLGRVTVAGDMYRGRKEANVCWTGTFEVADDVGALQELPTCAVATGRRQISAADVAPWNGAITLGVDQVTVPPPDAIDPIPGEDFWDNADLRVLYDVGTGNIELRNQDLSVHPANPLLTGCPAGTLGSSNSFRNNRELDLLGGAKPINMLEVNMGALLNCIKNNPALMDGKGLDETTNGGLVFYLGVIGPAASGINDYGMRVRNATKLGTLIGPAINGLTVVTNQAAYTWGNYNSNTKIPAAIISDSINILSGAWIDSDSTQSLGSAARDAVATTVNAAFLSGTDTTGVSNPGPEGVQDSGLYSGGVHNFLRLHEDWNSVTLTYLGSLVSLNQPQHVNGRLIVGSPQYNPPNRNYSFDTDFNDVTQLPPLTPAFIYLKQEMFVRQFEL